MNRRQLKTRVLEALAHPQWEERLAELTALPGERVVGALFGALLHPDPAVRWHAVTAFGVVVAAMATDNLEGARVVMRRFLWSLNDESGGIGWGAPESMAEIMAQSPRLADEYANHLRAFIHEAQGDCPDCYLEHAPLRRGAVWGLGRLAQVRPEHVIPAAADLQLALQDPDAAIRGYAAWAVGLVGLRQAAPRLKALRFDPSPLELYRDRVLATTTVGSLATEAMDTLNRCPQP